MNKNSGKLKVIQVLKMGTWHWPGQPPLLHTPLPALLNLYHNTSPSAPQGLAYALRTSIFQVGPAAKAGGEKLQALLRFKDVLTWNCTIHPTGSAGMRHLEKLHLWAARIYSDSQEQKLAQLGHIQRAATMHSELSGNVFLLPWGMSKNGYLSTGPFSFGLGNLIEWFPNLVLGGRKERSYTSKWLPELWAIILQPVTSWFGGEVGWKGW